MRILNYGSLNLDFVYAVDHIAQPGETIASKSLSIFCGGKGLNQSLALARAGSQVYHAGMLGPDGEPLLAAMRESGVHTEHIQVVEERTGNAIIQVDAAGQNSIILYGGANQINDTSRVDAVLSSFAEGDLLLLQNEVNLLDYMIERAAGIGMRIVLNPSPYNEKIAACDLSKVALLLINEVEGEQMTGKTAPGAILGALCKMSHETDVLLTLGSNGALYREGDEICSHPIFSVPVVDTTAAGDTFTGYFITALLEDKGAHEALRLASMASALAVSRAGASDSIPWRDEVDTKLKVV